jgi:hypothetical protein
MNFKRNRQCRCCKDIFTPDYRNTKKQAYCCKPECREASKRASQKQWSNKNPNYFKSPIHVDRVREWRQANPGRSRRKTSESLLQDDCDQITKTGRYATFATWIAHADPCVTRFLLTTRPRFYWLNSTFNRLRVTR